jgi:glycosyltransferase involved in cell wall biosynthesis
VARIAMVVSNGHAPDPRVAKEATSLAEAGHELVIYAFDRARELPEREQVEPRVCVERMRPPWSMSGSMLTTGLGLAYFRTEVRRRLERARPDAVHCHDQDTCAVGQWWKSRGARAAGLHRGRFVFDAHDLYWTWALLPAPDARWRQALAAALRASHRRYARAADLLVTVSEGTAAHPGTAEVYRDWGCAPVVVWNAPLACEVASPLPERFTVGYIGTVREPAMFERLIAAIGRLEPSQRPALRIAGSGRSQEQVRSLVAAASAELGIDARVTGAFHAREIPALMAECSVQYCVYPTRRGNIDRAMPVKLLEAIASGRRVLGNADTLMGDYIADRGWGWTVRDGDVGALADALRAARALCDAEGRRAPRLQPPPLWPDQGQRLVAAYERLLQ